MAGSGSQDLRNSVPWTRREIGFSIPGTAPYW